MIIRTKENEPVNCYDIIGDIDGIMQSHLPKGVGYVALGGIVSASLLNDKTIINAEDRQVIPPKDITLYSRRENGTKRDIDMLVCGLLSDEIASGIKSAISDSVDGQLEVSLFGFDQKLKQRPLAGSALDWLSRRTVDDEGRMFYELFPFEVEVKPSSYDPYSLQLLNGNKVEILHPVGHTLAYETRSISGLRKKDRQKVAAMKALVLQVEGFSDELVYGVYEEWRLFADAIKTLQARKSTAIDSELLCDGTSRWMLDTAVMKAEALGLLECSRTLERFAQSRYSVALKHFVGNK